jgi:hypothetical protein
MTQGAPQRKESTNHKKTFAVFVSSEEEFDYLAGMLELVKEKEKIKKVFLKSRFQIVSHLIKVYLEK